MQLSSRCSISHCSAGQERVQLSTTRTSKAQQRLTDAEQVNVDVRQFACVQPGRVGRFGRQGGRFASHCDYILNVGL